MESWLRSYASLLSYSKEKEGCKMKWNWDELFGKDYYIEIKNSERKYFGFHLICTKYFNMDNHCTVFTQESLIKNKIITSPGEYNLYIEWGTAASNLTYSQISDKLKEYLADYYSPYGSVSVSIRPSVRSFSEEVKKENYMYKYNLLEKYNQDIRTELFSCLGLEEDSSFDDFAEKFGGLSGTEILKKIVN